MRKRIYNPTDLAEPVGHFDRAVRLGDWLFISGTSALTGVTGPFQERVLVPGVEQQTEVTLDNLESVLRAAGGSLENVYEMRLTLRDKENFGLVDRILRSRLPKRGFIMHGYEGGLLHPAMELEIEANAYLGALEVVEGG